MSKDINKQKFSEETKLKVDIFAECFREWLPVFVHTPQASKLFIYDYFAGSGKDPEGDFGSPLALLHEIQAYCGQIKQKSKDIQFIFNEKITEKYEELKANVKMFLDECKSTKSFNDCCSIVNKIKYLNGEFQDLFVETESQKILKDTRYAKFIILDQYGFSEIDESVFIDLVSARYTDFIFFISSSFIRRFKDHPAIIKYIETSKINYDESKPKECHREIAKYFHNLIPKGKEYYLHHFTIKKGSNYYGLIFGTGHTLGMEKFLKVCWKHDVYSGESNFNIENDFEPGSLFHGNENVKIDRIREELKEKIVRHEITNNISGLKFVLSHGCRPNIYYDVIKELKNTNSLVIKGEFNRRTSEIHEIEKDGMYSFEVRR